MCAEMAIGLIPKLASYMSMVEEIYGEPDKAFIYIYYVSQMDNFVTYNMLYLFEGCFSIGQSDGLSFCALYEIFLLKCV